MESIVDEIQSRVQMRSQFHFDSSIPDEFSNNLIPSRPPVLMRDLGTILDRVANERESLCVS